MAAAALPANPFDHTDWGPSLEVAAAQSTAAASGPIAIASSLPILESLARRYPVRGPGPEPCVSLTSGHRSLQRRTAPPLRCHHLPLPAKRPPNQEKIPPSA